MENISSQQVSKMKELLEQIDLNSFNQSIIKDNKIIFILEDRVYRCSMPSQKDLALAEDLENRLKVAFLQKEGYVTRKRLKQILKENQEIDVEDLEKQKEECQSQLKDVYLELAITQTADEEILKKLKEQKSLIEEKFTTIVIEITEHMKPCIEEQVKKKYYEFLTSICTERQQKNDEWIRVWDELKDYENDNGKLVNNAVGYLQTLLVNIGG